MADGAFGLSKELAEETAPVWEKVKDHVTPLEWPEQARLISEINRLKRERDAVILAHNYMTPEIFHGVGDYVGDSLGLAKEAARSDAKVIVQAGVHFMAETSKILSPDKTVLIPDLRAGCSLASSITGADVRLIKERHPGLPVVTYVNTTADVKAETDICCTSANAVQVVEWAAKEWGVDKVILIPDEYLARNVAAQTTVGIIAWAGHCEVHKRFTTQDIADMRDAWPDAEVLAHPECPEEILRAADFAGSTAAMTEYVEQASAQTGGADHRMLDGLQHQGRRARGGVRRAVQPVPAHEAHHAGEHPRLPAAHAVRGDGAGRDAGEGAPGGAADDRPAAAVEARALRPGQGAASCRCGADLMALSAILLPSGEKVDGAQRGRMRGTVRYG
jgi:quinolinate synthase